MNQFDRLWMTRDAVLAWLGSEIASGRGDANASADIVMNATCLVRHSVIRAGGQRRHGLA